MLSFVHGATSPAGTAFDAPLDGGSWVGAPPGRGFGVWRMDARDHGRSTRAWLDRPPRVEPTRRGHAAAGRTSRAA